LRLTVKWSSLSCSLFFFPVQDLSEDAAGFSEWPNRRYFDKMHGIAELMGVGEWVHKSVSSVLSGCLLSHACKLK
jgi:hypothetical protein